MPSGIFERTLKTKKKMSESAKKRFINKENHPLYGKQHTEKTKEKIRIAHLGRHHTKETLEKMSKAFKGENNPMYGKHHTKEELKRMSKTFFRKGENHPNWQGGITPLIGKIKNCHKYRQWRSDIYHRDNFTCQDCGDNIGDNLETHHIKTFLSILQKYEITTYEQAMNCEELWDMNNGITLCEECHKKIHKKKSIKPFQLSLAI